MSESNLNADERALEIQLVPMCEAFGYGAVMQTAAKMWADKDPVGALTVGPCEGIRKQDAAEVAALVEEMRVALRKGHIPPERLDDCYCGGYGTHYEICENHPSLHRTPEQAGEWRRREQKVVAAAEDSQHGDGPN